MIAQLPDTTPEVDRESSLARAGRVIPNGVSAGGRDIYRDVIVRAQGAYLWNGGGRPAGVRCGGLRREFGD